MKKILLLSDTHGFIDKSITKYMSNVDEIWHAGDLGNQEVIEKIEKINPLRAVYGNIDDKTVRTIFPLDNIFTIEKVKVWITHIGGYPNKYDRRIMDKIKKDPPNLFISGHSHILKVQFDNNLNLLHMNPGAAGKYGMHTVRTMLRFEIENENIKNLEIIELG